MSSWSCPVWRTWGWARCTTWRSKAWSVLLWGQFEKIVDLGGYFNGSNGLSLLTAQEPGFAFSVNPATTQIQDLGTTGQENVSSNNDSTTYLILYSPRRELSNFAFDFDWNNDGFLELPAGVTIVDAVGVRTVGQPDQVYGLSTSILSFTSAEVDAISRKRSDPDLNDGSAWFGGNLTSAGDDYLLYEASSVALPVTGAAMTPGDINTGTAVQSPLVSLIVGDPESACGNCHGDLQRHHQSGSGWRRQHRRRHREWRHHYRHQWSSHPDY